MWGIWYVRLFKKANELRYRLPYWLAPVLGAAVCVGCAIVTGQRNLIGTGLPLLQQVFHNTADVALLVCAAIVVGKTFATVGTVGSGANGGLTTPTLVAGGYLGALCAGILGLSEPAVQTTIVAGAAGLLSAVLNVPIATAAICMEAFGSDFALPAVLGSAIGFAVAKKEVVYEYSKTRD